jgi:hypothetical protein
MAERMEWELVPLVREEKRDEVERLGREILDLDARFEIAPHEMNPDEMKRLVQLQSGMARCIITPCEAAEAPFVNDRTGWERDVEGAFDSLELAHGLTRDDFVRHIGRQRDCGRCRGASDFPGVSGSPCEFDLTHLGNLLLDEALAEKVQFEMQPPEMREFAEAIMAVLAAGAFRRSDLIDTRQYLRAMAEFLEFWAELGYGVAPAFVTAP